MSLEKPLQLRTQAGKQKQGQLLRAEFLVNLKCFPKNQS